MRSCPNSGADAFAAVTLPFLEEIYRLAARLARTPKDAEDIVAGSYDSGFAIFRRGAFENPRIAMLRELIKASRRNRRWNWRIQYSVASEDLVLAACDHLPYHLREVLLLTDVAELDTVQCAAVLGGDEKEIAALISQARREFHLQVAELESKAAPPPQSAQVAA